MNDELLYRNVEVEGLVVDIRVVGDAIDAVGPSLPAAAEAAVVDGRGGALLPGLDDHHIHLLAAAAALTSIEVGPPRVRGAEDLAEVLIRADQSLPTRVWLRAVGYHESVAGDLDRSRLDQLVPRRPVRLEHRSGARWVLNSAAIDRLRLDEHHRPELERDPTGRLTGRIHRGDEFLRSLIPDQAVPDLAPLAAMLAGNGVTDVTDTTPYPQAAQLEPLAAAVASGEAGPGMTGQRRQAQRPACEGGAHGLATERGDARHRQPVR